MNWAINLFKMCLIFSEITVSAIFPTFLVANSKNNLSIYKEVPKEALIDDSIKI